LYGAKKASSKEQVQIKFPLCFIHFKHLSQNNISKNLTDIGKEKGHWYHNANKSKKTNVNILKTAP